MRYMLLWLSIFVSCINAGCVTGNSKVTGTIRIHSELTYSHSGTTQKEIDTYNLYCATPEQRQLFTTPFGLTDDEVLVQLADPFLSIPLESITFKTIEPTWKCARFYECEFMYDGWREKRGLLLFEETNGGGDWLRVYEKENRQVLVHIVGRWEDDFDNLKRGEYSGRTVIFKFYRCSSDDVFGKANLAKVKHLSSHGAAVPHWFGKQEDR